MPPKTTRLPESLAAFGTEWDAEQNQTDGQPQETNLLDLAEKAARDGYSEVSSRNVLDIAFPDLPAVTSFYPGMDLSVGESAPSPLASADQTSQDLFDWMGRTDLTGHGSDPYGFFESEVGLALEPITLDEVMAALDDYSVLPDSTVLMFDGQGFPVPYDDYLPLASTLLDNVEEFNPLSPFSLPVGLHFLLRTQNQFAQDFTDDIRLVIHRLYTGELDLRVTRNLMQFVHLLRQVMLHGETNRSIDRTRYEVTVNGLWEQIGNEFGVILGRVTVESGHDPFYAPLEHEFGQDRIFQVLLGAEGSEALPAGSYLADLRESLADVPHFDPANMSYADLKLRVIDWILKQQAPHFGLLAVQNVVRTFDQQVREHQQNGVITEIGALVLWLELGRMLHAMNATGETYDLHARVQGEAYDLLLRMDREVALVNDFSLEGGGLFILRDQFVYLCATALQGVTANLPRRDEQQRVSLLDQMTDPVFSDAGMTTFSAVMDLVAERGVFVDRPTSEEDRDEFDLQFASSVVFGEVEEYEVSDPLNLPMALVYLLDSENLGTEGNVAEQLAVVVDRIDRGLYTRNYWLRLAEYAYLLHGLESYANEHQLVLDGDQAALRRYQDTVDFAVLGIVSELQVLSGIAPVEQVRPRLSEELMGLNLRTNDVAEAFVLREREVFGRSTAVVPAENVAQDELKKRLWNYLTTTREITFEDARERLETFTRALAEQGRYQDYYNAFDDFVRTAANEGSITPYEELALRSEAAVLIYCAAENIPYNVGQAQDAVAAWIAIFDQSVSRTGGPATGFGLYRTHNNQDLFNQYLGSLSWAVVTNQTLELALPTDAVLWQLSFLSFEDEEMISSVDDVRQSPQYREGDLAYDFLNFTRDGVPTEMSFQDWFFRVHRFATEPGRLQPATEQAYVDFERSMGELQDEQLVTIQDEMALRLAFLYLADSVATGRPVTLADLTRQAREMAYGLYELYDVSYEEMSQQRHSEASYDAALMRALQAAWDGFEKYQAERAVTLLRNLAGNGVLLPTLELVRNQAETGDHQMIVARAVVGDLMTFDPESPNLLSALDYFLKSDALQDQSETLQNKITTVLQRLYDGEVEHDDMAAHRLIEYAIILEKVDANFNEADKQHDDYQAVQETLRDGVLQELLVLAGEPGVQASPMTLRDEVLGFEVLSTEVLALLQARGKDDFTFIGSEDEFRAGVFVYDLWNAEGSVPDPDAKHLTTLAQWQNRVRAYVARDDFVDLDAREAFTVLTQALDAEEARGEISLYERLLMEFEFAHMVFVYAVGDVEDLYDPAMAHEDLFLMMAHLDHAVENYEGTSTGMAFFHNREQTGAIYQRVFYPAYRILEERDLARARQRREALQERRDAVVARQEVPDQIGPAGEVVQHIYRNSRFDDDTQVRFVSPQEEFAPQPREGWNGSVIIDPAFSFGDDETTTMHLEVYSRRNPSTGAVEYQLGEVWGTDQRFVLHVREDGGIWIGRADQIMETGVGLDYEVLVSMASGHTIGLLRSEETQIGPEYGEDLRAMVSKPSEEMNAAQIITGDQEQVFPATDAYDGVEVFEMEVGALDDLRVTVNLETALGLDQSERVPIAVIYGDIDAARDSIAEARALGMGYIYVPSSGDLTPQELIDGLQEDEDLMSEISRTIPRDLYTADNFAFVLAQAPEQGEDEFALVRELRDGGEAQNISRSANENRMPELAVAYALTRGLRFERASSLQALEHFQREAGGNPDSNNTRSGYLENLTEGDHAIDLGRWLAALEASENVGQEQIRMLSIQIMDHRITPVDMLLMMYELDTTGEFVAPIFNVGLVQALNGFQRQAYDDLEPAVGGMTLTLTPAGTHLPRPEVTLQPTDAEVKTRAAQSERASRLLITPRNSARAMPAH